MTQYFTDFSDSTPGNTPAGWTATWNHTGSWLYNAGGYVQVDLPSAANSVLYWSDLGSLTDCEILVKFRIATVGGASIIGTTTRLGTAGYVGLFGNDIASCYLTRQNSSSTLATLDFGTPIFPPVNSVDYWIRMQSIGTAHKWRIWEDGAPEPGTWELEATNASYAAGFVGLWARDHVSVTRIYQVGVTDSPATESAPASAPVTSNLIAAAVGASSATASIQPFVQQLIGSAAGGSAGSGFLAVDKSLIGSAAGAGSGSGSIGVHVTSVHAAPYRSVVSSTHAAAYGLVVTSGHAASYGLLGPVWSTHGAIYELSERNPVWSTHAAPYQATVASVHAAGYQSPVPVWSIHAAGYRSPVPVWSIHAAGYQSPAAVWSTHAAPYQSPTPVWSVHASGYQSPDPVWSVHAAGYQSPLPVWSVHAAEYQSPDPVWSVHAAGYQSPDPVWSTHGAEYQSLVPVWSVHAAGYGLLSDVWSTHAARYELLDHTPVWSTHRAPYALLGSPTELLTGAPALVLSDGTTLPIVSVSIGMSSGDALWQAELTLLRASDYARLAIDANVTLSLPGQSWAMVVTARAQRRSVGDDDVTLDSTVTLHSPAWRLTSQAAAVTQTWDTATGARAIVESLVGEVVDWRTITWSLPAYRFSLSGAQPLDAAQQLAGAVRAVIESDPDGSLIVRPLWPVAVPAMAAATPDHQILEREIYEISDSAVFGTPINRLRLSDIEATVQDRLEFVADEDSSLAGTLRAYPAPWRAVEVVTTRGDAVTLYRTGEVTRTVEDELIEFTAGEGSVQYPIEAIVSVTWLSTNLGGLTFEQRTTALRASVTGYSLAMVTYRVRSIDYRALSTVAGSAQMLLQEP